MKFDYDIIIVGAGPSGLAFAQAANYYNDKKILIIDKKNSIGGCHRVNRVNGLFSEHGPRVYCDNYLTFIDLLSKMGLKFHDLFTEYKFPITSIGNNNLFTLFTVKEYLQFTKDTLNLFSDEKYGDLIILKDYLEEHNFSD